MDYQALGLGDASSVITAVMITEEEQMIMVSCLYDPQHAQMPYQLSFKPCEEIAWDIFDEDLTPQHVEAELVGISLEKQGLQKRAVLTTDMFELSFAYGQFLLKTGASTSQTIHH
ncbi:MAG: hypothetical protein ETSY1_18305 [Candidatus Entotheonella factor]|uniref:Uncharacterized protein n=1 Tax=Entotheonella factor TaxID=1429438 RepID=W4LKP2_ENTF1|nr:hypothetical protein [Candidatus Entotheonella palauensis]ETW98552.1 MAG: hypothetical protein ETSY1_18305 [Candidatus Entotheonella factor]